MQVSSIAELAQACQLNVLVGPPGCGKTTETSRLVNEAAARGWEPLVASLTRAAAREIAGRDLEIDPRRVGTLHAHAYGALGHPQIAEGKLKEWNQYVELKRLPDDWRVPESYGKKPRLLDPNDVSSDDSDSDGLARTRGVELLEEVGVRRARMSPEDHWPSAELRGWYAAWRDWKLEAGYLDFTDLLAECLEQGISPAVDYDAVYLDEAQDMSRLEMSLALAWASEARAMMVVGDSRQNLYEWRGSDPAVFKELLNSARKTRVLSQSYRVPRAVHAAAVEWADQLNDGIDAAYHPRDSDGRLEYSGLSLHNYHLLSQEISDRASAGQSVMVLTACSYQLHELISHLRASGQPFHNVYRTHNGRWNPLIHAHKPSSTVGAVLAFSRVDDGAWGAESRMWTAPEVRSWGGAVRADIWVRGAKTEIAALADDAAIDADWIAERVANVDDLAGMFSGNTGWLLEHVIPSRAKGFVYPAAIVARYGPAALTAEPKITVGTIHSVKGGEASAVYLFPDLSPAGYEEWTGDNSDRVRRQMYVGMTRARDELMLGAPAGGRTVRW